MGQFLVEHGEQVTLSFQLIGRRVSSGPTKRGGRLVCEPVTPLARVSGIGLAVSDLTLGGIPFPEHLAHFPHHALLLRLNVDRGGLHRLVAEHLLHDVKGHVVGRSLGAEGLTKGMLRQLFERGVCRGR